MLRLKVIVEEGQPADVALTCCDEPVVEDLDNGFFKCVQCQTLYDTDEAQLLIDEAQRGLQTLSRGVQCN